MAEIRLYRRDGSVAGHALVDDGDAEWLGQWRWGLRGGYAARGTTASGRYASVSLHREIAKRMGMTGPEVDHINRNRLDNRRANLRSVTHAQQMQNLSAQRGSTSRYRGVFWDKERGKWRARVRMNGKKTCLGRFATETEAAEAAARYRAAVMPFAVD